MCDYDNVLALPGCPRDVATLVNRTQEELVTLSTWLAKNGLKINAEKTQLIVIGSKQSLRSLPPITVRFMGPNINPRRDAARRRTRRAGGGCLNTPRLIRLMGHIATLSKRYSKERQK